MSNQRKGLASPKTREGRPVQGATSLNHVSDDNSNRPQGSPYDASEQPVWEGSGYPFAPGHRGGDTDIAAAEAVKASAPTLERMALADVRRSPQTADEVHAALQRVLGRRVPLYSVRPRLSALKARGLVVDNGERRPSSISPSLQRVYRAATPDEHARIVAEREASR